MGKVNQTPCHIRRQALIQYPPDVIFKVPASAAADCFTGEQAGGVAGNEIYSKVMGGGRGLKQDC